MKNPSLSSLEIESPCPINLEKLDSETRTYYCGQCQLNVHNISTMTAREAEKFLRSRNGRVCVSIRRRADGSIYTDNCPRILRAARRRLIKAATIVGLATAVNLIGKAAGAQGLVGAPIDGGIYRGASSAEPEPSMIQRTFPAIMFTIFCLPAWIAIARSLCRRLLRTSHPSQLVSTLATALIACLFMTVVFGVEFSLTGDNVSWEVLWSHAIVAILVAGILMCFSTFWKFGRLATVILAVATTFAPFFYRDLFGLEGRVFFFLSSLSIVSFVHLLSKKAVRQYFMKTNLATSMSMVFGPVALIFLGAQIHCTCESFSRVNSTVIHWLSLCVH